MVSNDRFLQMEARELREALSPKFWKKLGGGEEDPRIYRLAVEAVDRYAGELNRANLSQFFKERQSVAVFSLAELWAIRPVLKKALLARISSSSTEDQAAIQSLRTLDQLRWNEFIESLSVVNAILSNDPAGAYARMDFETRDGYRGQVERLSGKGNQPEKQAEKEVRTAESLLAKAREEDRHIGHYLQRRVRYPHLFYFGGVLLITGLLLYLAHSVLAPISAWLLATLAIPFSQIALAVVNSLANRFVAPSRLPRMDFSKGLPDDCHSFIVVPTLILSRVGVEKLLERIEIHYLANRDPNLFFALLTDFSDAATQRTESDDLIDVCAQGIRALNTRYGAQGRGPFFLFHRERHWNPSEGVWMGRERKRGKLDDFNDYLLGRQDTFDRKVGDLTQVDGIRYIITLDTDTQLPRDTARELVAAMAHPLNRPVLDESNVVRQGYAILQPRVSISMESARRSRLANLYSGQTGLDPYTKAVSDVYQDLFGQASYMGKGIYDLNAFAQATRERFPDNTLLSHDLIEGEHARVGLISDIEVIDDFPATYEAFSKRKHRWVRGDWQISPWLLPRVPDAEWRWHSNPLSLLSRWKIFDNLRRSLYEISLVAFCVASLFGEHPLRCTAAVLLTLVFPAFAQTVFSLSRFPPLRFWRVFLRETVSQLVRGIVEALVQLAFLLHQALLMLDAIVRTMIRHLVTHRKLLEWESAAQAESGSASTLSLASIYLIACPILATVLSLFAARAETATELLPIAVMILWAISPLAAEFISSRTRSDQGREDRRDVRFLRDIALKTWRYFVDFGGEQDNWLVPDNVQEVPWAVARRSSPTNMGLQLVANIAAADFGYLTQFELSARLERTLTTLARLERGRGHLFNWYDTGTLQPLAPRYVSAVDSGNFAAALVTLKQSCAESCLNPVLSPQLFSGLRDHIELLRLSIPAEARTAPIMRHVDALSKQVECQSAGLYYWRGLLGEVQKRSVQLSENIQWLCDHWSSRNRESLDRTRYWMQALTGRVDAMLGALGELAPWLTGPLEHELRVLASDPRMKTLMQEMSRVGKLSELPGQYDSVDREAGLLLASDSLVPASRKALEDLQAALDPARRSATALISDFERMASFADRMFREMDFGFLLDRDRMLMRIGYDVETGQLDDSRYDLLASEARTAVFLAVAKGDFPREAWFRLGRKLTTYRGCRTLLSWSGTMFEYLMPPLFLRTFEESLLAESQIGAVRIQQLYCRAMRVPWGVSEAAHSGRDEAQNYQYRAFGIPVMALQQLHRRDLVIAPYATLLALPIDRRRSLANLRAMAEREWLGDYGFFDSIDFMGRKPVVVRSFMAHHQGMAFTALANALLSNPMPRRFHSEPMVLATELLLQERLPAMIDEHPSEDPAPAPSEAGVPAVALT